MTISFQWFQQEPERENRTCWYRLLQKVRRMIFLVSNDPTNDVRNFLCYLDHIEGAFSILKAKSIQNDIVKLQMVKILYVHS